MTASIKGRRAIVTGAAQGLGLACAHALAKAGADVGVCDTSPAVEGVAADLATYGGSAWAAVADASSPDDVPAVSSTALPDGSAASTRS